MPSVVELVQSLVKTLIVIHHGLRTIDVQGCAESLCGLVERVRFAIQLAALVVK